VSGKFEVRLNDSIVQTVEGTFNVPFEGESGPSETKSTKSVEEVEETKDDTTVQSIPQSKHKN
jgi:hypothetical protein